MVRRGRPAEVRSGHLVARGPRREAKQVWRSERLADPEAAFQAMVKAAKKRKAPVEVWRHGNVRVGLVGGGLKLEAA